MILEADPFALTGIVVTEVLQGLSRDAHVVERYLAQWPLLEPRGFSTYRDAAAIFRLARGKGVALTTIDSLIAAVAREHDASLFTLDRDFERIAPFARLPLHKPGAAGPG
jgi:predicted nucleic acid-binding protein